MSDIGQDPYDVLELPRNATEDEIKEAFRKLSLLWHPDKNPNGTEQFREIYKAYQAALMAAKNRASYDSFILQTRDPGILSTVKNYNVSGKLVRLAKTWFPMPSAPDAGYFHGKLKVAVFIGGVAVGAYVTYRIMQRSPPSIPIPVTVPVPEAVVPVVVSEIHPASLWTLVSWLAALRSKSMLRLARLTSGSSIRLPSKALNGSLSSAADAVANTVTQGPRAVTSAISSSSLTSAANVVAKTVTQGPQAVTSAVSSSSLTSAASVVAKSLPPEPQIALNSAAEVVAKTLTQGSQASKTVVAETLKQGSSSGYSSAADDLTKKTAAGFFKYWKWTTLSFGKGSAAVSPALTNFKTSFVKGATNGWKWTEPKIQSIRLNLERTSQTSITGIVHGSSSVVSSAARSSAKVIEKGTLKAYSLWRLSLAPVISSSSSSISTASRAFTEVIKKQFTSKPISHKTQTATPMPEPSPSPTSSAEPLKNLPKTPQLVPVYKLIIVLAPLCIAAACVPYYMQYLFSPPKPEPKKEIGYYSPAKDVMKTTYRGVSNTVSPIITGTTKVVVKGVTSGWNWTSHSFTNTVKPAVTDSTSTALNGVTTSWNWTASKAGSYLVSPLKNIYKFTLDRVVPPKS